VSKHYDIKFLAAIAAVFILPIEAQIAAACALADPSVYSDIADLFRAWWADSRKCLSRRDCQLEGGWQQSSQILKEKSEELRSFLDGKKRLITVSSFYQHLITHLILSNPAGGPARKNAATSTVFQTQEGQPARV
jgi:hypothetical protein